MSSLGVRSSGVSYLNIPLFVMHASFALFSRTVQENKVLLLIYKYLYLNATYYEAAELPFIKIFLAIIFQNFEWNIILSL